MENTNFKEIKNGDHTYQVYPLTGRAACHLDRKVTDIAFAFSGTSNDGSIGKKIVGTFASMDNDEFDGLVIASIPNVVRIGNEGEVNARLTIDNIYEFFKGDIDGLYGLLTQLWEAYELTPFAKAKPTGALT